VTNRENYLSIARRTGYDYMPVNFSMCPDLQRRYDEYIREHDLKLPVGEESVMGQPVDCAPGEVFLERYYKGKKFKPGTHIDIWGVAHEPGSAAAYHMTYMHHPMEGFDSVEQILGYPFPVFRDALEEQKSHVERIHAADRAAVGHMEVTIWETSWYMRGMENLMCDMMSGDPMAEALLDRVTDISVKRAESFARAGADALFLGDDVGMQHTIMMSEGLYDEWLKPRLKKVIDAARAIKPDILVFYHSCGHVTELIPYLIEAGVDVLNPVQPECMDFAEIHRRFGDALSFHGTIGTQSVMPFGTPEEVRRKVFENLDIAGEQGGLYVCPTHLLEPEVPVENVVAYVQACIDYTNAG
jgi:uroporphyrinogen decarboxylase